MKFIFKESAARQIRKLEQPVRIRILKKLQFYASQENPLKFADSIKDSRFGNWKFRLGNYRVLFDIKENKIIILKIGDRKEIYK
ncbi:MAG TPA: hypothetical protein ENH06_01720 [bacterium]|nr:hypothetical protein [bacterium]